MEKMKVGKFKKFNEYCGVARVQLEDGRLFFVVYNDTLLHCNSKILKNLELGKAAGKGKTVEEALIDAIKNLNKYIRKTEDKIESIRDKLGSLTFYDKFDEIMKNPICPVESSDFTYDENGAHNGFKSNGKYRNADIILDNDGKAGIAEL